MEENESRRNEIESEIRALQQLLNNSDYKCLKYAEGAISEEAYAETKASRQHWRDLINEYQEELEDLDNE